MDGKIRIKTRRIFLIIDMTYPQTKLF